VRDLDEVFAAFEVEATVRIDAPAEKVWDLITDVSRMREFSPEVIKAEWVEGGPHAPVTGARFAGTNQLGNFEWTRMCTIVDAVPSKVFSYVVGDRFDGSPSATWTFDLTEEGQSTTVRQTFAHVPSGKSGTRLLADADPDNAEKVIDTRRKALERGMRVTLEAIKDAIEKG
jgi:uncharacterized protein YndB with AHSA1/START domain